MEPFRFHVYVCDQKKPEGAPSCSARGSPAVIDALRREIAAQGLSDAVQLTTCASLGLCERGPNLVVYPEGSWYSGVRPEDVPEIVRGDDWTVPFIAAMHRGATQRAPLVVAAVGAEGVRRMLDVGGGSGAYSIAFARASAALRADILDLPTVLPIARGHVAAAGLAERVTTRAGDLRTDDFGSSYDLVLLSSICHMLGPEENHDLVSRAADALAPGGRVVLSDFVLDEDGSAPRQAVLFSINMLVGTPSGRSYRESELTAFLAEAGLVGIERVRLPGPAHLVVGRKPAA
jgi:SAM-dependent methyltransferase